MFRLAWVTALLTLTACGARQVPDAPPPPYDPRACGEDKDGNKSFVVLHLNDVYRIEGLLDGRGGLARVRSLREQLEARCGTVLVTHAGDALFPSLLSRKLDGEQMVLTLNTLDGDGAAWDPYLVATLGNHEFDKSKLDFADDLTRRFDDSQFTWLDTNVRWKAGSDGALLVRSEHLQDRRVVEIGGLRVGLFGLTVDSKIADYVEGIDNDWVAIARAQSIALREAGAQVVIAVTHLRRSDDLEILRRLEEEGPDLILGGHDHMKSVDIEGGRYVLKGNADATVVQVAYVTRLSAGGVKVFAEEVELSPATMPEDPAVREVVDAQLGRFDELFCTEGNPSCPLDERLTVATRDLLGEELVMRLRESNLGDWVADQMKGVFAADGAQIAFINSGALRLNQDISAGTPITNQVVEELFQYPNQMQLIELTGAELQRVIDHAITDWTGNGRWLQVSGFTFVHDVERSAAVELHLIEADGTVRPVAPDEKIKAVTVQYLLDPSMGDQDGYGFLAAVPKLGATANGADLKVKVRDALRALGEAGLGPAVEGRICTSSDGPAACLAIGRRGR
jgi:2',3'-cyclic-nucleotide 2'-phosphodiesterase (5'-nucleotidase family)